MKYLYTLQNKDLNKATIKITCPCCNHSKTYDLISVIGRVQKIDIGKRVYISKTGILSIENQEQLKKRLNKKYE